MRGGGYPFYNIREEWLVTGITFSCQRQVLFPIPEMFLVPELRIDFSHIYCVLIQNIDLYHSIIKIKLDY